VTYTLTADALWYASRKMISQFYLPLTRFISARATQDLEHYVRHRVPSKGATFAEVMEARVELCVAGFEPWSLITLHE
jgi:hypothetical protein